MLVDDHFPLEDMMIATSPDARFWDRLARKYATDPIKDVAGYERTLARTRQLLSASATVLEVGCGTGTTALKLAPSVSRILATDISAEMIAIAQEKATAEASTNVTFTVAPASGDVGTEGLYDAVLAFNVLHLIGNRTAALAEARRVLKPGGLLISKTPCLSEMNPFIQIAVPIARWLGKAPSVSFFDAAMLEADIAQAGFTIIERARHGSGRKDPRIFLVAQKAVAS
jgi:ubiquinone/menaquinone biosynthesis C-methylase UbiE